jgi:signal transduction histidine kinase
LVEDILDVSRAVSGKLSLTMQPISLTPVIEAALATAQPAAAAKNIDLRYENDGTMALVAGDERRLQQVLWNLLANATKFTPGGGRIEVQIREQGGSTEIRVSDTGQGIQPDFLPHIFERFRQADSSSTRAHGGLGLGLAIARYLVELHGGTIAATSPGLGHGSTFIICLPTLKEEKQTADDMCRT